LKIQSEPREDQQLTLTVEFEESELDAFKQKAARQIARRVRIPGFRPGKAPYPIILRTVGENAVVEQAVELLVDEKYPEIIKEADIHPYGPGSLEEIVQLDPPVLKFVVPLEADVTLGDYQSIKHPYEPREINDQEIEDVIKEQQQRQAILTPVERPAEAGDAVTIQLKADRVEEDDDAGKILIPQRSTDILVHAEDDSSSEWPFNGFSQKLLGVKTGDEISFSYVYPEDYEYESMRGVNAEFNIAVEGVKSRQLPELNDEFAAAVGDFETLDALRKAIHDDLETQAHNEYHQTYDEAVLDELVEISTIKYPPQMLENEVHSVIEGFERRMEQQGITMDLYKKTRNLDDEGLHAEAHPIAEKRLRRALVLAELAKVENIQISPDELQHETQRTISYLSQNLTKEDSRQFNDQRVLSNLVGNILSEMVTGRATQRLREIASDGIYQAPQPLLETPSDTIPEEPLESVTEAEPAQSGDELEIEPASDVTEQEEVES
jgi:trigger factor